MHIFIFVCVYICGKLMYLGSVENKLVLTGQSAKILQFTSPLRAVTLFFRCLNFPFFHIQNIV